MPFADTNAVQAKLDEIASAQHHHLHRNMRLGSYRSFMRADGTSRSPCERAPSTPDVIEQFAFLTIGLQADRLATCEHRAASALIDPCAVEKSCKSEPIVHKS